MENKHSIEEEEKIRGLLGCQLFQYCPPQDIEEFARLTRLQKFAAGHLICARGVTGSEFYIVMSGIVEITVPRFTEGSPGKDEPRTTEEMVRRVDAGGFFGEIACLEDDGIRTANARTPGGCVLLLVPKAGFLLMAEAHPRVAMGLVRHLAKAVRSHTDSLARLVPPEEHDHISEEHPTIWQRFAGGAAIWAAHWSFTALNLGLWAFWLAANGRQLMRDLPTMNGLTMWVGLQAIVMTTFVLVTQRRAEQKEKRRRDLEFQWASATMERINEINERLNHLQSHPSGPPAPDPAFKDRHRAAKTGQY